VAVPITDDRFVSFSGTSAAAPFVSGAAAWLWAQNPDLSAGDVTEILLDTSNDVGQPGVDKKTGAGILNLARIKEHDTSCIYDMAMMYPFVHTDQDITYIDISAQNRGTETFQQVSMSLNVNGEVSEYNFYDVYPDSTVSQRLTFKTGELDVIELGCTVFSPNQADTRPGNNTIHSTIRIKPQPSEN
jgi:subtilisin family serine protease